ncbi:MAG: 23S rRNA (pseudouridine(1915)-N(3))-methyltransferase RlmH [Clostridia bacterium]|nr:23S rRNA (pseudouridine(1915)-N(3))-methyltransferase RlmH [Clostridia bacterium]MBR2297161.1 23S rRNA (pseudouridine(1915)-N(3))-methyltransferase RlmH [Clostridia bacterium]
MLNIKIIATGDIKEAYLRDAIKEYQKRLSAWCTLEEIILKEERISDNPSEAEIKKALEIEEKRILERLSPKSYVIAMCIEGKQLSSEELSAKISEITNTGKSEIVFIIGSSYGLSRGVKERADYKLSISKLTFPHQLLRVILHETIYRSLSIINNTKYHK